MIFNPDASKIISGNNYYSISLVTHVDFSIAT